MKKTNNKTPGGSKKKYRPRLSPEGKAFLKKQHLIVLIHKVYNDMRAELCDGGFLLCNDCLCDLGEWIDTDLMMMTDCGFIVGFAFILDVFPEKGRSKLKMINDLWANVTKNRNSDFNCRYARYKKNNPLPPAISI